MLFATLFLGITSAFAAQECRIESRRNVDLAASADLYEFRLDQKEGYARFQIDFRSQGWAGGINICGERSAHYDSASTHYLLQKSGSLAIYSARCGGADDALEGRAQVVFVGEERTPAYVRLTLKGAAWSLQDGRFGKVKRTLDNVVCAAPGFDPAKLDGAPSFGAPDYPGAAGLRPALDPLEMLRKARR